jgi:GNAT superfamily N-acetyltransferase
MDAEVQPLYAHLRDRVAPVVVDARTVIVTLLATDGGTPVGTVALKQTGPYAEVKRLYVADAGRSGGVAGRLMAEIEREAASRGVRELFLQTGSSQPNAMALYERDGWIPTAPYGPYEGDELLSRCYVKQLVRPFVAALVGPDRSVERTIGEVEALDDAGVDLAILADVPLAGGRAGLDTPMLAAAIAATTSRIALAPRIDTIHTEPFNVAKAVQTVDWTSGGRAAWVAEASTSEDDARALGRREAPAPEEAWSEASAVIATVQALEDSWEDDAEIRDETTGRFIDKDRVHHVRVETEHFSVVGPSIVPRSPQGNVPVIVEVSDAADIVRASTPELALRVRDLASRALTVLIDVDPSLAPLAPHERSEVERISAYAADRRARAGADGIVLVGSAHEATRRIAGPAAETGTLRARLGIARPESRYAKENPR